MSTELSAAETEYARLESSWLCVAFAKVFVVYVETSLETKGRSRISTLDILFRFALKT